MVLLSAPVQRRRSTVLQRFRLRLARLGCGRRAQMLLASFAVAGLLLSGAALYLVQTPTSTAEAAPSAAERAAQAAGPIRDRGLWSMVAVLPPHAAPNTGGPSAAPTATSSSASGASAAAASALAASGIPIVAVQAYQNAAALADAANPACRITWPLLAAIGRIESNHGRTSGDLLTDGTSRPPVMGLLLDGSGGFATISDTDGGALDGSAQFDRAIGPMQFIPSTWAMYAADGNADGKSDPFNIFDASLGAAKYLCRAGGDLSTPEGLQRAVFSYNHVQSYVDAVLSLANEYAAQFNQGALPVLPVTEAPAPPADLPPATVGGPAPGADSIAPPSPAAPTDPSSNPPAEAPSGGSPRGDPATASSSQPPPGSVDPSTPTGSSTGSASSGTGSSGTGSGNGSGTSAGSGSGSGSPSSIDSSTADASGSRSGADGTSDPAVASADVPSVAG